MSKKIKVLVKEPGQAPQIKVIDNELEEFQKIVGGYIEVVGFPYNTLIICNEKNLLIVCNEEGKNQRLLFNFYSGNDCIVGTVVFVGRKGDEFISLSDYQISCIGEEIW